MNKHLTRFFLFLVAAGSLAACRDNNKLPAPAIESIPQIIPEVNPQKSFFNSRFSRPSNKMLADSGWTRPVFEFVVNPSQGYSEIQTVEVYKSIRRKDVLGPRVKEVDLTSFPATVSLNSQQASRGLFFSNPMNNTTAVLAPNDTNPNRMLNGDVVVFTFEYIMKDGRRVTLTPLSTSTSSAGAPTGTFVNPPYAAIAEFRPLP
jgi:hypothetical protein